MPRKRKPGDPIVPMPSPKRVLSYRELTEARQLWRTKNHHPGTVKYLLALALDTAFDERKKVARLHKRLAKIEALAQKREEVHDAPSF